MSRSRTLDIALTILFLGVSILLYFIPTGFEGKVPGQSVRCRGKVIQTDNSEMQQLSLVRTGDQQVTLELLDGPFKGQTVTGNNLLLGQMTRDKVFQPGDVALVVLTLDQTGRITFVNPQEHYRIGLELILLGLFALLLLLFGGWTGFKALLSFIFAALMIWKILVPCTLNGWDPIWVSLAVVTTLTGAIIFLVAGLTRKGLSAFLGAMLGVLTSCLLAVYFTHKFHVHGAVLPFAETLLYSGYGHLDLVKVYVAAVFLAASGAVMDLAMDVSASLDEVVAQNPRITTTQAIRSGLAVGRAVVGTMTTTLLLAYSGGYITLLMAFMAQGIPLANLFNFIYVATEVLKTLVGSFGLVTVAPFTAVIGSLIYTRGRHRAAQSSPAKEEAPNPL